MKSNPKQVIRRVATTVLCVMLIVGMMPMYGLPFFGKDDSRVYAATWLDNTDELKTLLNSRPDYDSNCFIYLNDKIVE